MQTDLFTATKVRLESDGGALLVYTPWNPQFVAQLKVDIPAAERKWDAARKVWAVNPKRGKLLQTLIREHYGVTVDVPVQHREPEVVLRLLDCRYIGIAKQRGMSESAFGWSNGHWSIVFPRRVLQEWFGAETRPGESMTLYGVLGVSKDASPDEVKRAYRRAAMQWHPDRCNEPDAAAQFTAIQQAYEVLGNSKTRAKYDMGLRLTGGAMPKPDKAALANGYRSPLRCGLILARGREILGRFNVDAILQWEDITDKAGRVLVTSWPMGNKVPREDWIEQ